MRSLSLLLLFKIFLKANSNSWNCLNIHVDANEFCQSFAGEVAKHCNSAAVTTSKNATFGSPVLNIQLSHLPVNRFVLPIRSPFDIIISSFRYHAHYPSSESWMNWEGYEPCPNTTLIQSELRGFTTAHDMYHISGWLDNITYHCNWAKSIFKPNLSYADILRQSISMMHPLRRGHNERVEMYRHSLPRYRHNSQLKGNDLYPAIRMEAFRLIPILARALSLKAHLSPDIFLLHLPSEVSGGMGRNDNASELASFLLPTGAASIPCINNTELKSIIGRSMETVVQSWNRTNDEFKAQSSSSKSWWSWMATSMHSDISNGDAVQSMGKNYHHLYLRRLHHDYALSPFLKFIESSLAMLSKESS